MIGSTFRYLWCLAPTFTIFLATAAGGQQDWPQWRGPQRDGTSDETGIVDAFAESGPSLLWQAEGLGKGYSSIVIAARRIFTLGRRGEAEQLIALDAGNGQEIWSVDIGTGDHSNGTPTVDGNRVYAIGLKGDLICADVRSGKILWKKNFGDDFGGQMMSGWGFSESPLIDGNKLICTPGAQQAMLVALDKRSGKEIWRAAEPEFGERGANGAGYSSVVISHGAGVKQYIQLTGRGLIGVRAHDGEFLWGYNDVANSTANISTPIVSGNHVFCSTGYGTGAALLKLVPDGQEVLAEEVYFLKPKTFQNHHGGMILVDDHIYAGAQHNEGFPICIELATGDIAWGGKERGPGSGSAAITYVDNKLIFRYQDGVVAFIDATDKGYRLLGSFMPEYQEDKSWAHPVVLNGCLYLREQDRIMCYNVRQL
ncbi:MAG: PQQ-like beta-propeller repeat protein [Pirellulaceae bacterium]|nr:PQQ-like beta-propeller repeat protein [Pirellulaceae bacterium]